MLTTCPECELQVSDKAEICPHCGYPLKKKPAIYKRPASHKKLPNGFGQITELKGKNLRKPFRVMVTTGHNSEGRPIQRILKPEGYFRTYNEAYAALVEYNKNPYDIETNITMDQLYKRWSPIHCKSLKSNSAVRSVGSLWAYCESVYDIPVNQLKAKHIKYCIENGTAVFYGKERTPSANTKKNIKFLFNQLLDYAVECEIVDRNIARTFGLSSEISDEIEENKKGHIALSGQELRVLWTLTGDQFADMMLIQCYMGWRPGEIINIKSGDVDIEKNIVIGGSKTKAGIGRTVPIHSLVRGIVQKYYDAAISDGREYLFVYEGRKMGYNRYNTEFQKVIEKLNSNSAHTPHDCRKTYITMAKHYKMDEYAIKRIVGHKINDVTEAVYTERPISWLIEETEKIKEDYIFQEEG